MDPLIIAIIVAVFTLLVSSYILLSKDKNIISPV